MLLVLLGSACADPRPAVVKPAVVRTPAVGETTDLTPQLLAGVELDHFLVTLTPPPPPPAPEPAVESTPAPSSSGGASQAWWDAISACEGGGPGQWRTGYFGIEAGYPIGGLSYAEQLAWAQRILAQYGPSAWGCWSTVGGPY